MLLGDAKAKGIYGDEWQQIKQERYNLDLSIAKFLPCVYINKTFRESFVVSMLANRSFAAFQQSFPVDRFTKISGGFCGTTQNGP